MLQEKLKEKESVINKVVRLLILFKYFWHRNFNSGCLCRLTSACICSCSLSCIYVHACNFLSFLPSILLFRWSKKRASLKITPSAPWVRSILMFFRVYIYSLYVNYSLLPYSSSISTAHSYSIYIFDIVVFCACRHVQRQVHGRAADTEGGKRRLAAEDARTARQGRAKPGECFF